MFDKLAEMEKRYDELGDFLCKPEIIGDQQEYKKFGKERSALEETVLKYREYKKTVDDIQEATLLLEDETDKESREYFEGEMESLKAKREEAEGKLKVLLLPRDPYADRNIIMEIRAGTGGGEAALFAGELLRMYMKYAESRRWKTEFLSTHPTDLGGIKEAVFSITGDGVYNLLKFESGVHRVQRVPATEAGGRIHTSTVTVAVLPEAEEVDIEINTNDLRIDTYRSSGAGGQHVNKTDSAIRITHLPTGIVVACQDERSQFQNKDKAMRVLRAKLLEKKQIEQESAIAENRKLQVGSGERSEKIRTYNFPQSRVTDHRISLSWHSLDRIMEGEIGSILDSMLLFDEKERLASAN